jgi:hypothetical protein
VKRTTLLAWALCILVIVLATAKALSLLAGHEGPAALFDLVEWFGWGWALPVVYSLTAAVILSREPRNRVGWLLMLPALVTAVPIGQLPPEPPAAMTPVLWLRLWLDGWSWLAAIFPILLIPLHFPTGRPPSARWNWVNRLALGMALFFVALVAFGEYLYSTGYGWRLANPIGFIPDELFSGGAFMAVWSAGLLALVGGSAASLFVRYRGAGPVEREQIKWLLFAGGLLAVFYAALVLGNLGTGDAWLSTGRVNLLFVLSLLALPVAIAVAILRYRLFDIDVIIRKTAVYGALSAVLALVYFGSVFLLTTLFGSLSGQESTLALVISTLLIAALFAPLRRSLQSAIDRRFFRKKYDSELVLARFAQTARQETDLEALTAELVSVLQETMQPRSIGLWIAGRDDQQ